MSKTTTCQSQAGGDVVGLEVWKLSEHLFAGQPICQKIQDVRDTNTHPSHAGAPAALLRIHGDSIVQRGHDSARIRAFLRPVNVTSASSSQSQG